MKKILFICLMALAWGMQAKAGNYPDRSDYLWMTVPELKDNYDSMETWTQIALEVL